MTPNKSTTGVSGKAIETEELCPMPDIAALIGGKWKLIILQILIFKGTKRFGELKRIIDGVTQGNRMSFIPELSGTENPRPKPPNVVLA